MCTLFLSVGCIIGRWLDGGEKGVGFFGQSKTQFIRFLMHLGGEVFLMGMAYFLADALAHGLSNRRR